MILHDSLCGEKTIGLDEIDLSDYFVIIPKKLFPIIEPILKEKGRRITADYFILSM